MSKRRTILITGGAGFIGSHLVANLLDAGNRVIVMDNLLTGDIRNVSPFVGRDFLFIRHDVTHYMVVDEPIDCVLHFASPASPADYLQHPIHTLKVGALGTHKAPAFCLPRPPRCTATRRSTRSPRATGAMSTRSAHAACTTRPSASPRP
jgi:nucleoside-diphosphate-sugar epimerase